MAVQGCILCQQQLTVVGNFTKCQANDDDDNDDDDDDDNDDDDDDDN